jgi:hypothetical protein
MRGFGLDPTQSIGAARDRGCTVVMLVAYVLLLGKP